MSLKEALDGLEEAVKTYLGSESRDAAAVLAAVFRLDNEIGKRLRPTGDPDLKNLQLRVNDVAVAAKMSDGQRLARAMDAVLREVRRSRTEH